MARMYPVHVGIAQRLAGAFRDAGMGSKALFYGQVPDGDQVPLYRQGNVSGMVAPHATLMMDEPDEHPAGRDITGARSALGVLVFEVLAVASDDISLTQLRDVIDEALVGWVLPDGGEVAANGGLATLPAIGMSKPARLGRELGYWGCVGATSGSPVEIPGNLIPQDLLFPSENLFPA